MNTCGLCSTATLDSHLNCLCNGFSGMAADWLGSLVSINCGPTLGVYQGEVASVDQSSQTISLRQPFHNGIKCPVPEVTFR